jgi:septum formation protein
LGFSTAPPTRTTITKTINSRSNFNKSFPSTSWIIRNMATTTTMDDVGSAPDMKDDSINNDNMKNNTNNNTIDDDRIVQTQTVLAELGLTVSNPLLLGSASFTRKLILKEMGVPFLKLVRPINEKELGDRNGDTASPHDLVLLLAHAKMDHLVQELKEGRCEDDLPATKTTPPASASVPTSDGSPAQINDNRNSREWILLTGDQVVTCQNRILEKPESIEEAKQFVQQYGIAPPSTVGSCVIHHHPSGIRVSGVDTATIYFHPAITVYTFL